jgi:hypothetical protein
MFSTYMQEVNFKNFIIFNLFYLCFSFGSHVFVGISSFRVCGVVPWLGSGRDISLLLLHTHTHTHTSFFLTTSLTTFLFTPHHFTLDPLWKTSSSSEAVDDIELLDAWQHDVGRSGCRCDTPGLSWKPSSSLEMISLDAPASLLSLSQTSSDIQFGDRILAVLCTLITDCLLQNNYSVWLIIMQLEQVVMQ